eukprot:scaffold135690_cov57-Attheya_sp.AAC.1
MPHLTRSRSGRAADTVDEVDSSEPSSAGCLSEMALHPKDAENPASDKTALSQGTTSSLAASTAEIKSEDKDEANKENMTQQVDRLNPATSYSPSSSIPNTKGELSTGASLSVRQKENVESETRPTPSSFSPPPSSTRKPMHHSTTKISLLPDSEGNSSIRSSSRDEPRRYSGRQSGGERSGRATEASPDDRSGHASVTYSSASKAPSSSSRDDPSRTYFRERGTPYGHPTEGGGPRQPDHATLTNSHQIRSAPSSMVRLQKLCCILVEFVNYLWIVVKISI